MKCDVGKANRARAPIIIQWKKQVPAVLAECALESSGGWVQLKVGSNQQILCQVAVLLTMAASSVS